MLRATHRAARLGVDAQQADVAHALEVRAHGVDVQVERLGHLGGRERQRRAGELQVDRVPGVVAESLEDVEARRSAGFAMSQIRRTRLLRGRELGRACVRRIFHARSLHGRRR
jgi:hypothetical protein